MRKLKRGLEMPADPALGYNVTLHLSIAKKIAELGGSQQDIAEAFNVPLETISRWETDHAEFAAVLKAGEAAPDNLVQQALFRCAMGYTIEREKPMRCNGKIELVRYKEHIPANVTALMFVLMNRKSSKWKHHSKINPGSDEDDPFLAYLKSINGNVLRPKEYNRKDGGATPTHRSGTPQQ